LIETERRLPHDRDTLLMFHMDGDLGPWIYDASTRHAHAQRLGAAQVVVLEK